MFTGFIYVTMMIIGCPKPCVEANYSFKEQLQLSPDSDSMKVGDTLYITASFPNNLIDQRSGSVINYSNASNIESTLRIVQLVTGDSISRGAVADFKYSSTIGMIYNATNIPSPDAVNQLKYQQIGNDYQIKVGLIPIHTGIFALGIGSGLSIGRNGSKECEKASFIFSISNTSQHVYYYQQWNPNIFLSTEDISRLYCFKVY